MTGLTHMKDTDVCRHYIELVESMNQTHDANDNLDTPIVATQDTTLISEIDDLIFKLNTHDSGFTGDRALGFDEGIQLAIRVLSVLKKKIEVSYDDNQSNI